MKNKSPLAGLADAKVKLERPDPAKRERMELVRECHKLAELCHRTYKDFDVRVHDNADGTFSCVRYDCREGRLLSMDWDGNVKLTTWEISGHNGDPYGEETRLIKDPVAAKQELVACRNGLLARAVDHERRLLEEAKQRKVEDVALANVKARLSGA